VIKSRKLRWAGHLVRTQEGRSAFKILTGKGNLGRPRGILKDDRLDLNVIGINTKNWVDLTQDMDYWRALVHAALNLRIL
jgi:hypothetical protein